MHRDCSPASSLTNINNTGGNVEVFKAISQNIKYKGQKPVTFYLIACNMWNCFKVVSNGQKPRNETK